MINTVYIYVYIRKSEYEVTGTKDPLKYTVLVETIANIFYKKTLVFFVRERNHKRFSEKIFTKLRM